MLCACAGFHACFPRVISGSFRPEQLHAASGVRGAPNQSGSWHGQVPSQLAPASHQKGGKILFLETQSPKQMKVSLLLGLILRFNSVSKQLIRIFSEIFFYFMKSFGVLTFYA